MVELKEKIIESLRDVYDPEIPINVYDLGLIYDIKIRDDNEVKIVMTLTSPTCPTADYIKEQVKEAVEELDGINKVDVELTFEPKWSPKMVSKEAKEELGLNDEGEFGVGEVPIESKKEKFCFSCKRSSEEVPIISCFFEGEDKFICVECIKNY